MYPNFGYNLFIIKNVRITKKAQKDLKNVPIYVAVNLHKWVDDIEERGLEEVRKVKSYHDEPVKGKRKGQRSIRLAKAYRAFYRIIKECNLVVEIQEVNKHEY